MRNTQQKIINNNLAPGTSFVCPAIKTIDSRLKTWLHVKEEQELQKYHATLLPIILHVTMPRTHAHMHYAETNAHKFCKKHYTAILPNIRQQTPKTFHT